MTKAKTAAKAKTAGKTASKVKARAVKGRRAAARGRTSTAKPQAGKVVRGKSRGKAQGVIGRIPVAAPEASSAAAMKALIRDKVLGKLAWNEGLGWYHSKIKFRNCPIDLCVVVGDQPGQLKELLERGRAVIGRLHILAHRAEDVAKAKIKEVESARIGGAQTAQAAAAPRSSAMKFKRYMRLKSVEIHVSGRVTFLHDDGNAFWGHLIETTMTPDEQVSEARLAA